MSKRLEMTFSKEDILVANKLLEIHITSLMTSEMQTESLLKYHYLFQFSYCYLKQDWEGLLGDTGAGKPPKLFCVIPIK